MQTIVKKAIPDACADTKTVLARIEQMKADELVEYAEFTELIGANIIARRHILDSARRMARRLGLITEAVRGIGIVRIVNDKVVYCQGSRLRKIKRGATRVIKESNTVDTAAIDETARVHHFANMAQASVIKSVTSRSVRKHTENAASSASATPPVGALLERLV